MTETVPTQTESSSTSTTSSSIKLVSCGLASGLICSFVFNPWDRALFLSVIHHRPFTHADNFRAPFDGVLQSIAQRALSSGLYFPLEEIFEQHIREVSSSLSRPQSSSLSSSTTSSLKTLAAGMCAGAVNALLLNPLSSIKYHMWTEGDNGSRHRKSMLSTASEMLQKGGLRLFFIGTAATVGRDAVFGMCFAGARHELPKIVGWKGRTDGNKKVMFLLDFVAASAATALSSPFNYVRNIHYSMPAGHGVAIPSHVQILRNLWLEGNSPLLSSFTFPLHFPPSFSPLIIMRILNISLHCTPLQPHKHTLYQVNNNRPRGCACSIWAANCGLGGAQHAWAAGWAWPVSSIRCAKRFVKLDS